MDLVKEVAMYAGYIISIITVSSLIIKPVREKITKALAQKELDKHQNDQLSELITKVDNLTKTIDEHTKHLNDDKEVLKCSIRNNITHLYYKYTTLGYIPPYERENVGGLYEAYTNKLQGNSYVKQCYTELMALPIADMKKEDL